MKSGRFADRSLADGTPGAPKPSSRRNPAVHGDEGRVQSEQGEAAVPRRNGEGSAPVFDTLEGNGAPTIIGPHPLGPQISEMGHCVGTVFPFDMVVISGPGVHALQKMQYIEHLNAQRTASCLPPLNDDQVRLKVENSVDLIIRNGVVFIRPHEDQMFLAFMADEILQKIVPKHRIKYLHLNASAIRRSIEIRGECWRINHPPQTFEEERRMIRESKIAIHHRPIYYYNMKTGTRYLTYHEFSRLGELPPGELLAHLNEIREHAGQRNARMYPEIEFFQADPERFSAKDFQEADFEDDPERAAEAFGLLAQKFRDAVPPEYRQDAWENMEWRNAMLEALRSAGDAEISEAQALGLSAEYFMKIQWLPGARIEHGGLIFDSVYAQCSRLGDPELKDLCLAGPTVKEFIFNAFRNRPDIESINIGRVEEPLSGRPDLRGYRGVYIEVMSLRGVDQPSVKIFRMQKWDTWQYLDDGEEIGAAMLRAAEYTNYILDRHLACRQIGMAVVPLSTAKVGEVYHGKNEKYRGWRIWSTYFERDYIYGRSTEKVPAPRFAEPEYALCFARLLGEAAAANIAVGRVDASGRVLFDDGDEIVQENESRLPERILVGDFTGSFANYSTPLEEFAESYAHPVNDRIGFVQEKKKFAREYLRAFQERFELIQERYRRRRSGFDQLFDHEKYDAAGSFPYRWTQTLRRLDHTDPLKLTSAISDCIRA